MFFVFKSDEVANLAKKTLDKKTVPVAVLSGALERCPKAGIPIFSTAVGIFKGTYLRHGTIESLRSRGIRIPAWAEGAKYGIALKRLEPVVCQHDRRFSRAVLSVDCVRLMTPHAKKPEKPAIEWKSGYFARMRQGRLSRLETMGL